MMESLATQGKVVIHKNPPQSEPSSLVEAKATVIYDKVKNKRVVTYECPFCSATLTGLNAYNAHCQKNHESKKFKCDKCSYTTSVRRQLYHHRFKAHKRISGGYPIFNCKIQCCNYKSMLYLVFLQHIEQAHPNVCSSI